jgi:hypothetical protein
MTGITKRLAIVRACILVTGAFLKKKFLGRVFFEYVLPTRTPCGGRGLAAKFGQQQDMGTT